MGTTISKNTTTRITEFEPFIFCEDDKYYDYRLECYITFNKPAKDINIKKIIISKYTKYSKYSYCSTDYIYDISEIKTLNSKNKENVILLEKGPYWNDDCIVYIKILIEENGHTYTLTSGLKRNAIIS